MKKAFTLVELLVVIGIIGALAGVLLVSFGRSTDGARMAKCASNMRNLATAIRGCGASAQSYQAANLIVAGSNSGLKYSVRKGWISYLDQGTEYPLKEPTEFSEASFAGTEEDVSYALTNGAIWKVVGGNRDLYLCPSFVRLCKKKGLQNPGWSYQMNPYFKYAETFRTTRADRILLLAEIPAMELDDAKSVKSGVTKLPDVKLDGGAGDPKMDACLLYKSKGGNESIGFNHIRGSEIVGHVAFADGHIETYAAPKNGNFEDLTDWLCQGTDVVYQNGLYQEVKGSNAD